MEPLKSMRTLHSHIMVGKGTLMKDNPQLNGT